MARYCPETAFLAKERTGLSDVEILQGGAPLDIAPPALLAPLIAGPVGMVLLLY
jgi:hypothetical protein